MLVFRTNLEHEILQALAVPAGSLEEAVRAWEPAALAALAEVSSLPSPP